MYSKFFGVTNYIATMPWTVNMWFVSGRRWEGRGLVVVGLCQDIEKAVASLWLIGGVDTRLRLGGRVNHDEFGSGTVASIATSGKIAVQFDGIRNIKTCRMQDLRPVSLLSLCRLLVICQPFESEPPWDIPTLTFHTHTRTHAHTHTHTHTHTTILWPSWILSGTTRVSRHQKGKTRKVKPTWIYWSKT